MTDYIVQGIQELTFEEATSHSVGIDQRRTALVTAKSPRDAENRAKRHYFDFSIESTRPATDADRKNEFIGKI